MRPRPAAISTGVVTAAVVTVLLASGVSETLELPVRDLALRLLPVQPTQATDTSPRL